MSKSPGCRFPTDFPTNIWLKPKQHGSQSLKYWYFRSRIYQLPVHMTVSCAYLNALDLIEFL